MKITRDYLKKIISEEIKGILNEEEDTGTVVKSNPKVIEYARYLKKAFQEQDIKSFSPEQINIFLDNKDYAGLTPEEKIRAITLVFGRISKMPDNLRQIVKAMNPESDAMAASPAGPSQPTLSLSGRGGMKCAHAAAIQTKAKQVVQTLASEFDLDNVQAQRLTGRLSDGIMGNTTLGIMKALSNGQMNDTEYPLNNMSSYKKACSVKKELLDSILNMMNTKPQEAAKIIMSTAGIQAKMAESKNISFEKALKAAILKEMKKNS